MHNIGKQTYFTKAIIYAPMEVEMFPPQDFKQAIKKLEKGLKKNSKSQYGHHRSRSLFTGYVPDNESSLHADHHRQKLRFQKRYNAYMLFMLNNSQDELLLAYTDFCKNVFPAGLPSKINGALP